MYNQTINQWKEEYTSNLTMGSSQIIQKIFNDLVDDISKDLNDIDEEELQYRLDEPGIEVKFSKMEMDSNYPNATNLMLVKLTFDEEGWIGIYPTNEQGDFLYEPIRKYECHWNDTTEIWNGLIQEFNIATD